jgi:hypothetical protein
VDTDDLVLCQVRALRTDVPGSPPSHPRAHILAADTRDEFEWESAKRFVANLLPGEILDKYFPLTGSCAIRPWRFDTSRENQFFNWQFKSFEECLGDLVTEYLWMRCLQETCRAEPSPILGSLQTWLHNNWSERCMRMDLSRRYQ